MLDGSKINFYRQQINRLDDRLFSLLKQRFETVERLKEEKKRLSQPLFDSVRETELMARAMKKKIWTRAFVRSIYGAIFAESHRRLKRRDDRSRN